LKNLKRLFNISQRSQSLRVLVEFLRGGIQLNPYPAFCGIWIQSYIAIMALLCIINGSLPNSTMSTRGGLIVCPDFSFSKNQDNIIIISVTSVGSSDPDKSGERARGSSDSVS